MTRVTIPEAPTTTSIFTVTDAVILRPLPYEEPDRLVRVFVTDLNRGVSQTSHDGAGYMDLRDQSESFDGVAAYRGLSVNLVGGEVLAWGRGKDVPELRHRAPSADHIPRVRVLRCRNHPGWGVLAFRVELAGRSVVYASDIEGGGGTDGNRLAAFCRECDILIHDAQYLPAEYAGKGGGRRGFGHSTFEMACDLASRARAGRLMLFHFSPDHDDSLVARMERAARSLFPGAEAAREGLVIDL